MAGALNIDIPEVPLPSLRECERIAAEEGEAAPDCTYCTAVDADVVADLILGALGSLDDAVRNEILYGPILDEQDEF